MFLKTFIFLQPFEVFVCNFLFLFHSMVPSDYIFCVLCQNFFFAEESHISLHCLILLCSCKLEDLVFKVNGELCWAHS